MRRAGWIAAGLVVGGCAGGSVEDPFMAPGLSGGDTSTPADSGAPTDDSGDGGDTGGGTAGSDGETGDTPTDDTSGADTVGESCGGITCDVNATCDLDTCVCDSGFEGDGESCIDIDGCADSPCFNGVDCVDVSAPGDGYMCGDCPAGYEGDGEACADIDGCADSPCFDGVICDDVPAPGDGFTCGSCPPGYEGDGEACADIDGCTPAPCFPGVTCDDVPAPGDGFACGDCPAGTFGDGIDCLSATLYELGGLSSSFTAGSFFRANAFVANSDGTLAEFQQYLGLAGACNLDFYVFEAPSPTDPLNQIWRDTVVAPASVAYQSSGPMAVPIVDGNYYVLGVAWNCSATYYWQSDDVWEGFDAGVGEFENNRWDNAYSGASDFYMPPGTGTTATYPQRIYFAG